MTKVSSNLGNNSDLFIKFVVFCFLLLGSVNSAFSANGLNAYWSLDDDTGSIATDQTGNGVDLSLANMTESNWVGGFFGSALEFDGINQKAFISSSASVLQTESITISAWINPVETSVAQQMIVTQSDNYFLYIQPGNRAVVFSVKKAGGGWAKVHTPIMF